MEIPHVKFWQNQFKPIFVSFVDEFVILELNKWLNVMFNDYLGKQVAVIHTHMHSHTHTCVHQIVAYQDFGQSFMIKTCVTGIG